MEGTYVKLFTVGPTEMSQSTLAVAGSQIPYFRNQDFSNVVLECESWFKELSGASQGSKMVLLTASGTAAMEAAVMNCFTESDKLLVIDGGSFGHRFAQICAIHDIPYETVVLQGDETLALQHLAPYEHKRFTGLLVNLDETSTGQLYDIDMLSAFCKRNDMLFVVDAISAFAADPIRFDDQGVDVLIVSSQKALALAPGIALVLLSERMLERIQDIDPRSMYFDFKSYLENGKRGQTPFTPAVGIVYELHNRLREMVESGGIDVEIARVAALAMDFRSRIQGMPISTAAFPKSNAVTRITFDRPIAAEVNAFLIERYGFVLNPCGGEQGRWSSRVSHIGNLTLEDNAALVEALAEALKALAQN